MSGKMTGIYFKTFNTIPSHQNGSYFKVIDLEPNNNGPKVSNSVNVISVRRKSSSFETYSLCWLGASRHALFNLLAIDGRNL